MNAELKARTTADHSLPAYLRNKAVTICNCRGDEELDGLEYLIIYKDPKRAGKQTAWLPAELIQL